MDGASTPTTQSPNYGIGPAQLAEFVDLAPDSIVITKEDGTIAFVNAQTEKMFGYRRDELIGQPVELLIPDRFRSRHLDHRVVYSKMPRIREMGVGQELRGLRKDGAEFPVEISLGPIHTAGELFVMSAIRDLTDRRKVEQTLNETEERFRLVVEGIRDYAIVMLTPDGLVASWNSGAERIVGYRADEIVGQHFARFYTPQEQGQGKPARALEAAAAQGRYEDESWRVRKDGTRFWASIVITPLRDPDGRLQGFAKVTRDITERRWAEHRLAAQYAVARTLTEASSLADATPRLLEAIGSNLGWEWGALWQIDHATELARCVEVWHAPSAEGVALADLSRCSTFVRGKGLIGRIWASRQPCWVPDLLDASDIERAEVAAAAGYRAALGFPICLGSDVLGVVELFSGEKGPPDSDLLAVLNSIGHQISQFIERKRTEEQLRKTAAALARQAEDLARSNAELQQFAYVASHDLQEPLRMVASYTQLLGRRYKGKLDQDADEFIAFAVDGATRMQALINDLLTYSRVGTRGKEFSPTDCSVVVDHVLGDLDAAISEAGAVVSRDDLPTVMADGSQLGQVFQNLIANAIKYRGERQTRIHVGVRREDSKWIFSVRDNGIGIEPQYFDRIFVLFQRLHGKGEYPGTGIGLAICKKIVERHGGRIWLESQPGEGSTFFFTIPAISIPTTPS